MQYQEPLDCIVRLVTSWFLGVGPLGIGGPAKFATRTPRERGSEYYVTRKLPSEEPECPYKLGSRTSRSQGLSVHLLTSIVTPSVTLE
jgi:hypothetical protein